LTEILTDDSRLEIISDPNDPRLQFDAQTFTVILDKRRYQVENPKAFILYKTIADKKGAPITRAGLRQADPIFRGDKTVPRLLKLLPRQLRKTIKSSHSGYWLQLASKN
jgi:hypothetical protein